MIEDFAPFLRNSALLLSLTFIYTLFVPTFMRYPKEVRNVFAGGLFGIFTIFTMNDPVYMSGGGIMDARHVIVMVAAIVGGFQGGLVAALISSLYRIHLGGLGTIPGVNSIMTAALLGYIYYRLTNGDIHFNRRVILIGLLIPFVPLTWLPTMPDGIGFRAFPVVAPPILITYPLATYMLMWLLSLSYQRLHLLDTVWQYEQRQNALFQQTPTLLMTIKPDGTILDFNPAMEVFLARKRTDFINKKRHEVHWDDPIHSNLDCLTRAFQRAIMSRKIVRENLSFERGDNTVFMDAFFIPILDTRERISMILVQVNDITDELRMREKELALIFEQERNDILKQLIADASHHLRTPLSIIGSSLYLLKKYLADIEINTETQNSLDNHFNKISEAQIDLNQIVEDLLNLMRLDNSEQYQFQVTDVVSFVRELCENYTQVAVDKEIQLETMLPEQSMTVSIAPNAFRRVVENLIENGLRYTPAGGRVNVTLSQDDEDLILRIADTGIGIPEEDILRIFDRFFRAGNALAKSRKGTGLGLAIVKKTVDMHNGNIEIESTVDVGTTVTVRIPSSRISAAVAS